MPERKPVILKLSGELFEEESEHISFNRYDAVAGQILNIVRETKAKMALVVGGGNVFRGREANSRVDHNEADSMGMMATIINGIGLREALVRNGAEDTRLMSAVDIPGFAEPYIRLKGKNHLKNNRIIILVGGLGKPSFSTDSAVAQYADELGCGIIFKASTVDGVYDSDPHKNEKASKYSDVTFRKAMIEDLGVMDKTAFAMCERSGIPIFVFDIKNLAHLPKAIAGDYSFGTLIHK
ncbi:MAG: UMP kinase [Patescibacteria group bacterium]